MIKLSKEQRLSIGTLEGLKKNLDIFCKSEIPSRELLQLGLYSPLLVCRENLVWGFHILYAASELGEEELFCKNVGGLTIKEMLKLALKLEARPGRYSWIEKENMFMLLRSVDDAPGLGELSGLIEGREDPNLADKIESFSQLNPSLKQLVAEQLLDLKTALKARYIPEAVFLLMHEAEKKKLFSFSSRRLFLLRLSEIILKKRMNNLEILSSLERALTAGNPLEMITRLRYPELSQMEDRFDLLRNSIFKGTGIRLEAPSFFEGDSFSVSFNFNNSKNLAGKIHALANLKGKCDELFALLR